MEEKKGEGEKERKKEEEEEGERRGDEGARGGRRSTGGERGGAVVRDVLDVKYYHTSAEARPSVSGGRFHAFFSDPSMRSTCKVFVMSLTEAVTPPFFSLRLMVSMRCCMP